MPTRTGYVAGPYRGHLEGSSSRQGGGDKVWGWLCCLLFAILLVSVVVLVALGARESLVELPYFYSPQDSRLVRLETTLCRGLTLTDKSFLIASTLYSLSTPPQLRGGNDFTLTKNSTLAGSDSFLHWYYFLHFNSNVTVRACVEGTAEDTSSSSDTPVHLQLYVVRGRRKFNKWVRSKDLYYVQRSYSVVEHCTAGWTEHVDNIQQEDEWYFILYNPSSDALQYHISLEFHRSEYVPTVGSVIHWCVAGGEHPTSCTIPSSTDASYLVVTGCPRPPETMDYELEVDVDVRCVVNEGLLASIIIVPALLGLLLGVVGVMVVWYCCYPQHFSATCHKCSSGQQCHTRQPKYEEI